MIEYQWCAEVTGDLGDDLRRLLARAAEVDAEAGFPSFGLDDEVPPDTRYLLIWLLPDERSGREDAGPELAGCLRLEPEPDTTSAEVRLVIAPELRSRGISTLLCERLGLSTSGDGWAGTGCTRLRSWARGNHPAAGRLALRFADAGLRRSRREWRLVIPLHRGADMESLAGCAELPAKVVAELREGADEPGFDAEAVLSSAVHELRAAGADIAAITVDDRQHALLSACRKLGFQHDRTDCEYVLG